MSIERKLNNNEFKRWRIIWQKKLDKNRGLVSYEVTVLKQKLLLIMVETLSKTQYF